MLPGINIEFQNGALGTVVQSPDGVFGVVANAIPVTSTFVLEKEYVIKSMQDVAALGIIDSVDNHRLYKFFSEFYNEAGEGTEIWLMGFANTKSMSDLFTPDGTTGKAPVEKLLDAANGRLHGLFTVFNPEATYTITVEDGVDSDVPVAVSKAQLLAENYAQLKYAPLFVIIEAYGFDGSHTDLADLTTQSNNRVGVLIGDTESRTGSTLSQGCAVGVIAGRLASSQVHVNIGKVRDGALSLLDAYILDTAPELYDIESLHDKGYITFRTHIGKTGYFFTDDPLATEVSDDYHYLTRRRVIDKAYRVVYNTLLDFLLDDFDVSNDGTISPIYAKTIEGKIESAIYNQMTVNKELSVDSANKDDKGVIVKVDLDHNVTSTSKLKFKALQVKPKGYSRYIDVPLGFVPVTNN